MNNILLQLARGGSPLAGGIAALAGGVVGGAGFLSASGAALGAVTGLGLFGATSIVASFIARTTGLSERTVDAGLPSVAMGNRADAATGATSSSLIDLPLGVPVKIDADKIETTETEAELVNSGRFAEYHLAKAKRFFAAQDFKQAAYQARASLSHGEIAEAAQVLSAAKAALR